MDSDSLEKRHRHHKKHKHKKHKKHKRSNREPSDAEGGSTEQEIELDHVEYSMDMTEETVTVPSHEHFIMDAEHCEGALEVIEELVEIDGSGIDTINIEEMVLENYGQDYEELVDVDGVDEEILEDIEDDLIDEGDDFVDDEEQLDDSLLEAKAQTTEDISKSRTKMKDRSKRSKEEDDASSGEEAWLEALESGKLEEVDDELKKIKNPKLMTARQRALLERKGELQNEEVFKEELVALPTGYKETVMTEEVLQKKALKSQRRREVAAQKRETEKKRTIDRLLQKKESKLRKTEAGNGTAATSSAAVSLVSQASTGYTWKQTSAGETFFSVPVGAEFPLPAQTAAREPPAIVRCGVQGCANPKRYSCSKTAVPLCSLQCYKTNMTLHQRA